MVNTILNDLDIWTAAKGLKSRGRNKSVDNISPHGIDKLRQLILELAVRGKLVPQDSNEDPASVLLKNISAEQKNLFSEISKADNSFELPAGWAWGLLPQVVKNKKYAIKRGPFGSSIKKDFFVPDGYKVYEQQHAIKDDFSIGKYYIDEKKFSELKAFEVRPNDIIISCSGTVGKVAIAPEWMEPGIINQALLKISLNENALLNNYFKILFPAYFMETETLSDLQGTAQKNIVSVATLKNEFFPLPPIEEQKRIVDKVDELLALCDQLEENQEQSIFAHHALVDTLLETLTSAKDAEDFTKAWQRIAAHFDTVFTTEYSIDKLKETILQLAVMGKLVLQNPDDEPASVLLEKIAAEKERLIKEGKIKKQKPLPEISEEEKPFELPESWTWIRLGDVTNYGITNKAEFSDVSENTWVLELEDVEKESSKLLQKKRASNRNFLSSKNRFEVGDVIYGKLRPYLDKVIVADEEGVCTTEMMPIRGYIDIIPEYLKLVLKTSYFIHYANESTHGMNLPRLGTEKARLSLFPLTTKAEQIKIVAKVDELFALCDEINKQIEDAENIQVQLADAVVEQVVA